MDVKRSKPLLLALGALLSGGLIIVLARSEESPPTPEKTKDAQPKDKPKDKEDASQKKENPPEQKEGQAAQTNQAKEESAPGDVIAVAPPPFTPGIFPCSGCHDEREPNPTPRQLKKRHKEIVLKHGDPDRWCTDCHTLNNIDKLHLANGKLVDFTESYKLCGQCHGERLRDWKAGEHGKRTGSWDGKKEYLLCATCHNPHSPKFQPLKPLPPPKRPRER
ncbi:MAG: hypothetical protein ABSE73_03260 [Planctomycetota bacterium]